MSANPLVLTFDIGTQSARAMLIDSQGEIVGKRQKVFDPPYFSQQPDWAEQKPEVYWDAMCECSVRLKDEVGTRWADIIAVSCTSIRDTCVYLDREGKPTRDVILWLDKRKAKMPPLPAKQNLMFKAAGVSKVIEVVRSVTTSNWVIQNEPQVWAKTEKLVLLSAYFNLLFTGRLVDSSANTVGHVPFDVKTRSWFKPNDPKRCLFSVEDEKLCELVEPGTVIGSITSEASARTGIPAGTPFVTTGPDKGCETLGLGCIREDCAALSFGTTATIEVTTDRYFEAMPFVPPYPALAGLYNPEVEIFRGYWLISWFKKEFAAKEVLEAEAAGISPEELLNSRLREVPPGCDGLMLQPFFTPDATTPHAKGAIIGFSDAHTRIHIYRAIVEGVNFALMEGLEKIEKRGKVKIHKLFVAGGGARSREICQITANMFGLPVYRIQTHEASGIGSAMVAFLGMKVFADYNAASKAMTHVTDEFKPDMRDHALYKALYERVFKNLFQNLSPVYKEIDDILGQHRISQS